MVDRVMVTATSQIGVDINAVAASSWLSAPLPFTPGLGPRKAQALLRAVGRAGGFVESRNQMWLELGVFGNRVFRNAAPFLRVRASVKGEGGGLAEGGWVGGDLLWGWVGGCCVLRCLQREREERRVVR